MTLKGLFFGSKIRQLKYEQTQKSIFHLRLFFYHGTAMRNIEVDGSVREKQIFLEYRDEHLLIDALSVHWTWPKNLHFNASWSSERAIGVMKFHEHFGGVKMNVEIFVFKKFETTALSFWCI